MKPSSFILTEEGYIQVENLTSKTKLGTDKRVFNKESVIREKEPIEIFHPKNLQIEKHCKHFLVTTDSGFQISMPETESLVCEPVPFEQTKVKVKDLEIGSTVMLQSGKGLFGSTLNFKDGLSYGLIQASFQLLEIEKINSWSSILSLQKIHKSDLAKRILEYGSKLDLNSVKIPDNSERFIIWSLMNYGIPIAKNPDSIDKYIFNASREFVNGYLSSIFSLLGVHNGNDLEVESLNDSYLICSNSSSFLSDLQRLILNYGLFTSKIDFEKYKTVGRGLAEKLYIKNKVNLGLKISNSSEKYIHKEISIPSLPKPQPFRFDIRSRINTSKITSIEMHDYAETYRYTEIDHPVIINGFNVFIN